MRPVQVQLIWHGKEVAGKRDCDTLAERRRDGVVTKVRQCIVESRLARADTSTTGVKRVLASRHLPR